MWTTRWIPRDPDLLLDEMQFYQEKYGAENFDFYDLTAIVKKSWILDFCRKIEEREMKFTWQLPSGTRTEAIDGEVASLLYRAGCRNMSYSPESGSPTVLRRIKKKIHPGKSFDKDLYELPEKEVKNIPTVCGSLREAMESLDKDREFLTQGDVFTDDQIDAYIALKFEEIHNFEHTPHPIEFEMYYSC